MFLKSLILRGFKTFADKTIFEFDPSGITAIVGPNGCGKSNTVDSFRFILGEGSSNELRIKNLTDVIFAGTQEKKPLSLAEVCLTLDNTDQSLPIDFTEVQIRRRTFRDGTSEFSINNNTCRLKDIKDLFLDAGVSEDSLAIIGQGKVDAILSSQPEERRAVFEEVAGIRKYKQRKIEAEKKLILAEQNLLRISDLKNEISENLGVLEQQAQAAEEYTKLKDKLRELDLGIAKKQVGSLLEKAGQLKAEIDKFKENRAEHEKQQKIVEAEKQELREKARALDIELENAFTELENIKEKMENERSSFLIEQQRTLFDEKNKLRDLKEAERFVFFEINQINNARSKLDTRLTELKTKAENIEIEEMDILPELKAFFVNSEKLLTISKSLISSIHDKKIEDQSMKNKLQDMLINEIREVEEQKTSQDNMLISKTMELENAKDKSNDLKKQLDIIENENKDTNQSINRSPLFLQLQESHHKFQDKIGLIKKEKEETAHKLDQLESHQNSGEVGGERDPFLRSEIQLAKTEGELSQITERIQTEYLLSVEDLLKLECEVSNIVSAKKESGTTRTRMFELEPVNLLAISEYKQSQERHKLITEQYEDLDSARKNLKQLIYELDLKAKEEFLQKIEIVARHFKEIYSQLFIGGEAKLELALKENNNPLEAGIEIQTCPSGRKWLPLQSLSGGERALTAIAILFAFLKTNPSPFCILDEVDAALDDANIDRFASYLKKMSSISQIMIITHNKHTMKVADTLYGITMQEPGVSRILSMKMDKLKPQTV